MALVRLHSTTLRAQYLERTKARLQIADQGLFEDEHAHAGRDVREASKRLDAARRAFETARRALDNAERELVECQEYFDVYVDEHRRRDRAGVVGVVCTACGKRIDGSFVQPRLSMAEGDDRFVGTVHPLCVGLLKRKLAAGEIEP